jgi:hypothetical protein
MFVTAQRIGKRNQEIPTGLAALGMTGIFYGIAAGLRNDIFVTFCVLVVGASIARPLVGNHTAVTDGQWPPLQCTAKGENPVKTGILLPVEWLFLPSGEHSTRQFPQKWVDNGGIFL